MSLWSEVGKGQYSRYVLLVFNVAVHLHFGLVFGKFY